MKINSTNKSIDFSKNINANENIVMLPNKILYLDEGTTNKRYIRSSARSSPSIQNHLDIVQENTSIGRIRLMIGSEENVIVENSQLYSKRVITAVAGVKGNTYNSNGDNNVVFQRNNSTYMTFNTNRVEINQELRLSNALIIDTAEKLTIRPSLEPSAGGDLNIFDIRNLHPVANNPMIRFRCGEGGGTTIICHMTNDNVTISRDLAIGTAYQLKCNTLNSSGDNDLVLQRNGTTRLELLDGRAEAKNEFRFVNVSGGAGNGTYTRFTGGKHTDAFLIDNTKTTFHINYYSHGNVFLGTNSVVKIQEETTHQQLQLINFHQEQATLLKFKAIVNFQVM